MSMLHSGASHRFIFANVGDSLHQFLRTARILVVTPPESAGKILRRWVYFLNIIIEDDRPASRLLNAKVMMAYTVVRFQYDLRCTGPSSTSEERMKAHGSAYSGFEDGVITSMVDSQQRLK